MTLRRVGADPADRPLGTNELTDRYGVLIYVNELELGLRAAAGLRLESAYGYRETKIQLDHVLGIRHDSRSFGDPGRR